MDNYIDLLRNLIKLLVLMIIVIYMMRIQFKHLFQMVYLLNYQSRIFYR